jgi:hypothetical protein
VCIAWLHIVWGGGGLISLTSWNYKIQILIPGMLLDMTSPVVLTCAGLNSWSPTTWYHGSYWCIHVVKCWRRQLMSAQLAQPSLQSHSKVLMTFCCDGFKVWCYSILNCWSHLGSTCAPATSSRFELACSCTVLLQRFIQDAASVASGAYVRWNVGARSKRWNFILIMFQHTWLMHSPTHCSTVNGLTFFATLQLQFLTVAFLGARKMQ